MQKKERLSKLNNLTSDFNFKEYLSTDKLSTSEKQLLFKLRTRKIPVKGNLSLMYKDDLSCRLCNTNQTESQEHLLSCSFLTDTNEGSCVEYIFRPHISHFKSYFNCVKDKVGLFNSYNLSSYLAIHELVPQKCHG